MFFCGFSCLSPFFCGNNPGDETCDEIRPFTERQMVKATMTSSSSARYLPWLAAPLFAVALAASPNGESTRLLRSPTVSAKQIAFAYANNIWVVDRTGGVARRLTSFQGQTTNPHFSPDGQWIAFSGEYAGNFDIYVVAVGRRRAEATDLAPGCRHGGGLDAGRQARSCFRRRARARLRAVRRDSGRFLSRAASRSR